MKIPSKKMQRFQKEYRKGRVKYPQESRYEWLSDLLDAYLITDVSTKIELDNQIKNTNREIACKKGCYACCLNPTVPINQVEIMGLSWYVGEIMSEEDYSRITDQLLIHEESTMCPFLLDGSCSVYPVRPLACRVFHMFDEPCDEYEDVSITRPEDVAHGHKAEFAWLVSKKLMPHMGINDEKTQFSLFKQGYMMKNTRPLHTFDWIEFKNRSDSFRDIYFK